MKTIARSVNSEADLGQLSGSSNIAPELTLRQKFIMVLVAVVSSFAVGSIPLIYAFTLAPTHGQTTTQSPFPRGEMF